MNWETTLQLVVIVLALGVTTGLAFGGLGLWVHFLLGTSPWWSAGLAAVLNSELREGPSLTSGGGGNLPAAVRRRRLTMTAATLKTVI
jgi:hypothetical protein